MSRRRRPVCAALLGAALQFCASAAVAAQVIVCRAPDGRVEIESVFDGDCCPMGGLGRGEHEVRASEACNGCVDTPLLRAVPSRPAADALAGSPLGPWRMTAVATSHRTAWTAPLAVPDSPRPRRSIVLRI